MSSTHPFAGFFDLQVNGYKGIDFSSAHLHEDEFVYCIRELNKTGTIGFLPTMITSAPQVYERNLRLMNRVKEHREFRNIIPGFHIEGPFISNEDGYRGVHPAKFVKAPGIAFFRKLQIWSGQSIRLLTMAAELKGATRLCRYMTEAGVAVSLGHQHAGEVEITRMANSGASAITHLGNGIPHLIHRHQNPLWAALADDRLKAMVVADGFHLPLPMLKTILKAKGINNTILVSDLSPVSGLKPGLHKLWGHQVKLGEDGFLHDPVSGYLAASSRTMLDAANYILKQKLMNLSSMKQIAFLNPLRLIGIPASKYQSTRAIQVSGNHLIASR